MTPDYGERLPRNMPQLNYRFHSARLNVLNGMNYTNLELIIEMLDAALLL